MFTTYYTYYLLKFSLGAQIIHTKNSRALTICHFHYCWFIHPLSRHVLSGWCCVRPCAQCFSYLVEILLSWGSPPETVSSVREVSLLSCLWLHHYETWHSAYQIGNINMFFLVGEMNEWIRDDWKIWYKND